MLSNNAINYAQETLLFYPLFLIGLQNIVGIYVTVYILSEIGYSRIYLLKITIELFS